MGAQGTDGLGFPALGLYLNRQPMPVTSQDYLAGAWGAGAAASHWILFLMVLGDQHNSHPEIGH